MKADLKLGTLSSKRQQSFFTHRSSGKHLLSLIAVLIVISGCTAVKKDKSEVGFIGRKWHDMNARYNGYFNAKELYRLNMIKVEERHSDNYNQLIPLDIYASNDNAPLVEADMDKAIEKVVKVSALHEPSKWVDDCYVLMGKAQFLKGDYESAEETFEYFVDDFNPRDPDSRVYESPDREASQKQLRKQQERERKIKEEERKKAKKEQEEAREQAKKDRERKKKEREKARKQKNKDRKKGNRSRNKKENESIKDKGESVLEGVKDLTGKANEKLDAISVTEEVSLPDGDIATAGNKPLDPDEEYIRSFEKGETPHLDRVKAMERYNKGGFLKHKPAYYEGMLWLAKTYVVREKFLDAGYYLRKLTEENGVPEHILREVPVVLADMSLRERNYDEAIVHLEEALNASKDKKLNARMAFILAQLYQTTNQNGKAYEAFDRVNDYKPNFDMSVSAQLNQLRNAWASGSDSSKDAIKKLEKMAKQAKYAQQLGMIYYSIAEIYLADGDEELALEYFNKSLTSGTNPASSSETYFRLAQLYLDKEEYLLAKNYFDSTLNVMTEKDERHPYVQKYSQSLTDIARQIDIITTNDSILVLADMQEDELIAWARKSAVKKLESEAEAAKSDPASGGFTATTSVLSGNSKFFAYNQTALQRGRSDFRRRWGNRPLEDDWRRSDKPSNLIESEEIEEQVEEISEEDVLKEIEKIIREVPREEEQIARVKDRVENALFQLGTGYRTYIQNYQKSNATLFTLRERFSETDKRLDSYYFNYLNYLDLEDEAQAQEYYNLILSRYPDSDYAKFLSNPTGDNVLVSDERRIEIYYEQTYDLFSNGNFTEANKRLIEAESKFGKDHDLIAKFDLLKAMCIGNLEGQKEYINALRGVILTHNNTPEQTHAREMLRFLRGDEEAFGGEVADEALEKFVSEDDKLHYVIVILYDGTGAKVNEAKKSINNYNNDNHKDARLRSTSIYLSQPDKTHLILIRRFQDKPTAMTYFKDIETNKKGFLNPDEYSYETFAINQKNYREVIKQKSVKSYRVFFENMYLGEVN